MDTTPKYTRDNFSLELVSSHNGIFDFNVDNSPFLKRITVSSSLKKGDMFNISYGAHSKGHGLWLKRSVNVETLKEDLKEAIIQSHFYQEVVTVNPNIFELGTEVITFLQLGEFYELHAITKHDRFVEFDHNFTSMVKAGSNERYTLDADDVSYLAYYQQLFHTHHEFKREADTIRVFSLGIKEGTYMVMAYETEDDVIAKKGLFKGSEGYFNNARTLKENLECDYHLIKIFDTEMDEVTV